MYGSVEQAFVGRNEPKNGCEGGYSEDGNHGGRYVVLQGSLFPGDFLSSSGPFIVWYVKLK